MSAQQDIVKILIVDDDEDDFIITSEYIHHIPSIRFQTDWCPNYDKALKHMKAKDYDLYFVDYRLGAKSGVDLLKDALKTGCEEPIVLLTGKGNYSVDIEAMQLGAVDYLIKTELTMEKMERCIRYALERYGTLKALRANERKYRSIFERSKDIIFITDGSLAFRDINDAVCPLLGYSKEEMLGMTLYDLMMDHQQRQLLAETLELYKKVDDWEVVLLTKEGERKYTIITAALEDHYTHEVYIQGIIHDITNLKKIEKTTLQAEKLAAAGRLVRTLAHEVRNPLNNITLSVEQMLQDIADENIQLYLNIIHRNGKRINDLISELLNTSRPTETTLTEHILQHIMDDVIAASIDRLTLKHIKLQVSYPNEPQVILADKEKLKLALLNIVINAIEAMQEKTGILSVSLHHEENSAVLAIRDNGCGISEENISRLFEPYFTQKRNGMGLGLAFTLNMLQSHKATIEVSSTPNVGTTFTITFPLDFAAKDMAIPGVVKES